MGGTLAASLENVHATLEAVDPDTFRTAVDLLAARSHQVAVLSGEATFGIAHAFAADLALVRPGVELVAGSEVRVDRSLALLDPGDVVVVMDLRRYERWVVAAARAAAEAGARLVAVTDSALSPLAEQADAVFTVEAVEPGPVRQPRRHAGPRQRAGGRRRRPPAPLRHRPPRPHRAHLGPLRRPHGLTAAAVLITDRARHGPHP